MAAPAWIALLESGSNLLLEDASFLLLEGIDGLGGLTTTVKSSATTTTTIASVGALTVRVGV